MDGGWSWGVVDWPMPGELASGFQVLRMRVVRTANLVVYGVSGETVRPAPHLIAAQRVRCGLALPSFFESPVQRPARASIRLVVLLAKYYLRNSPIRPHRRGKEG